MHDFTPVSALIGGGLIGLAASLLLLGNGRIAGVSGILGGLIVGPRGDRAWRAFFLLGLFAAGILAAMVSPQSLGNSPRSWPTLIIAGLLVGVGTRMGQGCTSGHGVCGISRLSLRSLVATAVFIVAGMVTVRVLAALAVSNMPSSWNSAVNSPSFMSSALGERSHEVE